jgi:hypothetical protein
MCVAYPSDPLYFTLAHTIVLNASICAVFIAAYSLYHVITNKYHVMVDRLLETDLDYDSITLNGRGDE